jgi:hypothetical protein
LAAGFLAAGFLAAGFLVALLPLVADLELVFLAAGFFTAFLTTFFAGAISSSLSWIVAALFPFDPEIRPPAGSFSCQYNPQNS